MSTFHLLKQRHRSERSCYSAALSTRVHRALSWLNKAENCEDDDSTFIFLWIAFNSAYAQDFEQRNNYGEKGLYQEFLAKLVEIDGNERLSKLVWDHYSSAIRLTLDNEYILQAFWDFHSGRMTEAQWKEARSKAKAAANYALANNDTASVLAIVFARLYTLRNQIIHGGATCGSSANRKQLRDCTVLLEKIVPVIIELMMDGKDQLWGEPVYPLIEG
ncbi:HEPN domain-containing protein [Vibrio sp. CAU 1672]|uniref:HEPN domain-containing protein n=1 Tax=Vibrio sp. CAU 1672 TaxID=3032594 RepID=UPI0023DB25C4|nr:HEPN domain-containing protein [Vibrio sp. CAU 1672]MDF2154510.1 HEPN domain-containing protein [Vibrio sp. CAU 1672]